MRVALEDLAEKKPLPKSLATAGGLRLLVELARYGAATKVRTEEVMSGTERCILEVLRAYKEALMRQSLVEEADAAAQLAQTGYARDRAFGWLGFTEFSRRQYEHAFMMSEHRPTIVALTAEKSHRASELGLTWLQRLLTDGAELLEVIDIPRRDRQHTRLSTEFADDAPAGGEHTTPDESVQLILAQGHNDEREQLVAAASQEVAAGRRTAVVVPDLVSRVRELTAALAQRNVAFDVDMRVPLNRTGFGAALTALLRLCVDEEECASAAAAFVTSAYSGVTPDEARDLDARWRKFKTAPHDILNGLHTKGADYINLIERGHRSLHPGGDAAGRTASRSASQTKGPIRAHVSDWSEVFSELLANGLNSPEAGEFVRRQDAAAHNAATKVLQELMELRNTEKHATAAGWKRHRPGLAWLKDDPMLSPGELLAALDDCPVTLTAAPGSRRLLLTEPHRVAGHHFDCVIMGALHKTGWDGINDTDIITDIGSRLGLPVGHMAEDAVDAALYRCYRVMGAARSKLVLIGQSHDDAGEAVIPSGFLELLQQTVDHPVCDAAPSAPESHRQNYRADACPKTLAIPEHGAEAYYDLGQTEPFSVSTLEYYTLCPLGWFLQRSIRADELDKEFGAADMGTFFHAVLQKFYVRLSEHISGAKRVTCGNLPLAHELMDAVYTEELEELAEQGLEPRARFELENERGNLHRFLESEPVFAPGFHPLVHEYRFGDEGNDDPGGQPGPPVRFGGVALRGRIDRIDIENRDGGTGPGAESDLRPAARIIVTDYKSKNPDGTLKPPIEKAKLIKNARYQGAVYLSIAADLLQAQPAAFSYRGIRNAPDLNVAYRKDLIEKEELGLDQLEKELGATVAGKTALEPEAYDDALDEIRRRVAAAADGLRQGRLSRAAAKTRMCAYCPWEGCDHYEEPRW
jgi:hypothetical protein